MKKKVNVYVLIDPVTCKVRYVGITTQTVLRRYHKHVEEALYSNKSTHKLNWVRSLISKGRLPVVKKLTEVEDWHTALKIERMLIEKHKVLRNLTNNEDYVAGAFKRTITDEQKLAASLKTKAFYEKGGKPPCRKEIKCFKVDGTFVRNFESMTQASKVLNLSLRHISLVVEGKKPQVKGYMFKKINEKDPEPTDFDPNWGKKKKVKMVDLDSNVSKTYSSITELAKELCVSVPAIYYYLKNPSSLKNKKIEII